jgi:hypothetical protein
MRPYVRPEVESEVEQRDSGEDEGEDSYIPGPLASVGGVNIRDGGSGARKETGGKGLNKKVRKDASVGQRDERGDGFEGSLAGSAAADASDMSDEATLREILKGQLPKAADDMEPLGHWGMQRLCPCSSARPCGLSRAPASVQLRLRTSAMGCSKSV